jgi:hypothetical protein
MTEASPTTTSMPLSAEVPFVCRSSHCVLFQFHSFFVTCPNGTGAAFLKSKRDGMALCGMHDS